MNDEIRASFESEVREIPSNKFGLVIKPSVLQATPGWQTVDVAIVNIAGEFVANKTFEYTYGTDPIAYVRQNMPESDFYFLEKTSSLLFENQEEVIRKTNQFLDDYNNLILETMMSDVDFSNLPVH